LVRLKLLQTGNDYLREMALLVAVGDLHSFVQFAFAKRAGHGRSERA
jgi:hypothetical protein